MLFRKPVDGDHVRSKETGSVTTCSGSSYSDLWMKCYADQYEFVSVTPIEPPPPPRSVERYVFLYEQTGELYTVVDNNKRSPLSANCLGRTRVTVTEGQFDD